MSLVEALYERNREQQAWFVGQDASERGCPMGVLRDVAILSNFRIQFQTSEYFRLNSANMGLQSSVDPPQVQDKPALTHNTRKIPSL